MGQAAGRSRGRAARQPTNPLVILGVAAALVGMAVLAFAVWFYVSSCHKHDRNEKLARGIALLNELTPIACDYFYSGKADKGEKLPDEAWAPFRDRDRNADLVDAAILDPNPQFKVLDAASRRDAKSINAGQDEKWTWAQREMLGEIIVVHGSITIGTTCKPVIFFQRPIVSKVNGKSLEHGKATIILLADAPVPKPAKPKDAAPAGKKVTPAPGPESPAPEKKRP